MQVLSHNVCLRIYLILLPLIYRLIAINAANGPSQILNIHSSLSSLGAIVRSVSLGKTELVSQLELLQ